MPVPFLFFLVAALGVETGAAKPMETPKAFRTEPLVSLKPVTRLQQWLGVATGGPSLASDQPSTTSPKALQLENRRTGVTCSMRILAVKPVPDGGIIATARDPHLDPIVRSSLSPCVE